jgi:hypothetical protein
MARRFGASPRGDRCQILGQLVIGVRHAGKIGKVVDFDNHRSIFGLDAVDPVEFQAEQIGAATAKILQGRGRLDRLHFVARSNSPVQRRRLTDSPDLPANPIEL